MNNKKIIICTFALVIVIIVAVVVISVVVKNSKAKDEMIDNKMGVIIVESDENETQTVNIDTNNSSVREIDEETLSQYN